MGIITRIEDLIRKAKSEGIPFNTIMISTEMMKSIDRHFFFLQDPIDKSTGLKIKKFDEYEVIEDKSLPRGSIKLEMRKIKDCDQGGENDRP